MSSVHSSRWHRVSALKPSLSAQLRLRRQQVRGETWYLLAEPSSGRSVRLNHAAYAIAARLDGRCTVQELWEQSLERDSDAITQDEVIDLLAQLREAALVQFDRGADFDTLLPHLDKLARPRGRGSLLAWRFPLGNPTPLLRRLEPLHRLVFSGPAFWLWLALMASLLLLALQHGPQLWAHGQRWMATPRFVLLAALLYVPIKLLHELAHGLAVRRWGGEVREAGVTLMLLMPVPYVNASAATSFPKARARIAVSAAGIMTELTLAALALPLWLWLDPGLARDCAFVVLVVAGVSTVLFNANPLQRLDGYYILGDALGLPNLGPRSRAWWLDQLRRHLLRLPGAENMPVARGETLWLAAYAPLAWLMILLISALALVWIGHISFVAGLICALVLGWQVLLRPIHRLLSQLRRAALAQDGSTRRWRRVALGASVLLLVLLLLPWPRANVVQGVVWPPDQAQLRVEEAGFVAELSASDGQMLQAGDVVLRLASPQLQSELARQDARVRALEAELMHALPGGGAGRDATRAGDARAELTAAQAELTRLAERADLLTLRARSAGRLVLPQGGDLPGQFLRRGHLLGQTLTDAATMVRVAWPETAAGALRDTAQDITVRLSSAPAIRYTAQLVRDSQGAVLQLPSAALGTRHGGAIVTDPQDADGRTTVEPVLVLDVRLDAAPDQLVGERIGERAWVRFGSGFAPLALQWAQALRREVLRRFNPQS